MLPGPQTHRNGIPERVKSFWGRPKTAQGLTSQLKGCILCIAYLRQTNASEAQWPPSFRWPIFRKLMFWIFAATSLSFLVLILYALILYTLPSPHDARSGSMWQAVGTESPLLWGLLVGTPFSVCMAALSGIAAWTIWKAHPWARGWAIAASLMYVVIFIRPFIFPIGLAWDHHLVALSVGLVGLFSFVLPHRT